MSDVPPKNYYQILGLPRSASEEQVRAAYRALAIKCHPDTSHYLLEPGAEFKRITEAYDVLSDPDKRGRYDRLTRERLSRVRSRSASSRQVAQTDSSYFGVPMRMANTVGTIIGSVAKFGPNSVFTAALSAPGSPPQLIESDLPVVPEEVHYGATIPLTLTIRHRCWHCSGLGQIQGKNCTTCEGNGVVTVRQPVSVTLPIGTPNGSVLHFPYLFDNSKSYDVLLRVRIQSSWRNPIPVADILR